jgi:hypothetical protein
MRSMPQHLVCKPGGLRAEHRNRPAVDEFGTGVQWRFRILFLALMLRRDLLSLLDQPFQLVRARDGAPGGNVVKHDAGARGKICWA